MQKFKTIPFHLNPIGKILVLICLLPAVMGLGQAADGAFWQKAMAVKPGDSAALLKLADWCLAQKQYGWCGLCCRRLLAMGNHASGDAAAFILAQAEIHGGHPHAGHRRLEDLVSRGHAAAGAFLRRGKTSQSDLQREKFEEANLASRDGNWQYAMDLYDQVLNMVPKGAYRDDFIPKAQVLQAMSRCCGTVDLATASRPDCEMAPCKRCLNQNVRGYITCRDCKGKGKKIVRKVSREITRTYTVTCTRCKGHGFSVCTSCRGMTINAVGLKPPAAAMRARFAEKFMTRPSSRKSSFSEKMGTVMPFLLDGADPLADLPFFHALTLPSFSWMKSVELDRFTFPMDRDQFNKIAKAWYRLNKWHARAYYSLWFASRMVQATTDFSILSGNPLGSLPSFQRLSEVELEKILPFPDKYKEGKFISFIDVFLGCGAAGSPAETSPGGEGAGDDTKVIIRFKEAQDLALHCFAWTPQASAQLAALAVFWRDHTALLSRKYPFDLADNAKNLPFMSWVRVSGRLLNHGRLDVRRMFEVWEIEPALTPAQKRLLPYVSLDVPAFQAASCPLSQWVRFIHVFWGCRLVLPEGSDQVRLSVRNTGCSLGDLLGKLASALECSCYWDGLCFRLIRQRLDRECTDFDAAAAFAARGRRTRVAVDRVR